MKKNKNITFIMTAVIQDQDVDLALKTLEQLSIPVTLLASSGGFLGRRNSTLLIGIPDGEEEEIITALKSSCRQRVEYLAMPLEGSPLPMPTPVPITVGGATIFTLPVERYEEI